MKIDAKEKKEVVNVMDKFSKALVEMDFLGVDTLTVTIVDDQGQPIKKPSIQQVKTKVAK